MPVAGDLVAGALSGFAEGLNVLVGREAEKKALGTNGVVVKRVDPSHLSELELIRQLRDKQKEKK